MLIDCVLFDRHRHLSLRLSGLVPSDDIVAAADQFREELEGIHVNLIA